MGASGQLLDTSVTTRPIGFVQSAEPRIRLDELAHSEKEITLKGKKAYLRISSDGAYYYMQVSENGKSFETLCKMDFRYLSTEVIGGFTGVMLGVFAQGTDKKGYADFDWFEYKTK